MAFTGKSPTATGEVFSVTAKIKNIGEAAACPGKVALYVSSAIAVQTVDGADAVQSIGRFIAPGQEMEVTFTDITAPEESGPHYLRVCVNPEFEVFETSEENNQQPLFYFLNNITAEISVQGSQLTLTWDSFEGQSYTILAAPSLDAFEDYIPDDGNGMDDFRFCQMEATPPSNSATIGTDENRFFKIRVDNLTDDAR